MVDLSDFIEGVQEDEEPKEVMEVIRRGCTYEEVRDLAIRNRTTHPNEPVEWQLDSDHNTYTLKRVVLDGTRFCR